MAPPPRFGEPLETTSIYKSVNCVPPIIIHAEILPVK